MMSIAERERPKTSSAGKTATKITGGTKPRQIGAQLVVRALEAQGVSHVFGIPGAKIDAVFNALVDSKIKTVVCRHEQNAAFIAGGIGRMTGKAGSRSRRPAPVCRTWSLDWPQPIQRAIQS
jgi:hypothetical protein